MIALHAGRPAENSIKVLVISDTANDVEVFCNGQKYIVPMERTGYPRPAGAGYLMTKTQPQTSPNFPTAEQVCFTGCLEVVGLKSLTQYEITAEGYAIRATTAPAANDDFTVYIGSCISTVGQNVVDTDSLDGMFSLVRQQIESGNDGLPVVGYVNVDDSLYIDYIHSRPDGFGQLGRDALSYNTAKGIGPALFIPFVGTYDSVDNEWNCAVSYLHIYEGFLPNGRLGDAVSRSDRGWCYKNINWLYQWGDHEFGNDIGIRSEAAYSQADYDTGAAAWNKFYGRIQPDLIDAGNSNAWSITLGSLQIVAPDRVTQAGNCADLHGPAFGNTQVDSILSAVAADASPFKIIGMSFGIRSMDPAALPATANQFTQYGPQQGMWNMGTGSKAEYEKMFTAAGGLIDLSNTNNFTFCCTHGDWHFGAVIRNENSAGTHAENFLSFHAGTVTGSHRILADPTWVIGDTNDGSRFDWLDERAVDHGKYINKVDVFGSHNPKMMRVSLYSDDDFSKPKYTAWYKQGQAGNLPVVPNMRLSRVMGE